MSCNELPVFYHIVGIILDFNVFTVTNILQINLIIIIPGFEKFIEAHRLVLLGGGKEHPQNMLLRLHKQML